MKETRTGMGVWGSDPDYPVADWQYEVANDDTRLGYWEWVEAQREHAEGACGDNPHGGSDGLG